MNRFLNLLNKWSAVFTEHMGASMVICAKLFDIPFSLKGFFLLFFLGFGVSVHAENEFYIANADSLYIEEHVEVSIRVTTVYTPKDAPVCHQLGETEVVVLPAKKQATSHEKKSQCVAEAVAVQNKKPQHTKPIPHKPQPILSMATYRDNLSQSNSAHPLQAQHSEKLDIPRFGFSIDHNRVGDAIFRLNMQRVAPLNAPPISQRNCGMLYLADYKKVQRQSRSFRAPPFWNA